VKPLTEDEAFDVASKNRPDIGSLRGRAAKARRDELLEARNARPETALAFGVARQYQRSIGAPNVTAWGLSIDVALPLFDRNQGNRARARSAVVQSDHELTAALAALRGEVAEAVSSLDAAIDNAADFGRTSLELAAQVRDSFRKAYEAGGRPLVELLDAQRSYREIYRAYIASRADYWRALSQYEAVLGTRTIQ
jgi:cobalt-zinc-cadmium efflux system outer membrane protein